MNPRTIRTKIKADKNRHKTDEEAKMKKAIDENESLRPITRKFFAD